MGKTKRYSAQQVIRQSKWLSFCLALFTAVLAWHGLALLLANHIENLQAEGLSAAAGSTEHMNAVRVLALEARRNYYLLFLAGFVILVLLFSLFWSKLWQLIAARPKRLQHLWRVTLLVTLLYSAYQAGHLLLLRMQQLLVPYFRNPVASFYVVLVLYGVLLILCIVAMQLISAKLMQAYSAARAAMVDSNTTLVKLG